MRTSAACSMPPGAAVTTARRDLPDPVRAAGRDRLGTPGEGIRLGEAIGLARADRDLDGGVLTIRDAKFGRSRLVPLPRQAAADPQNARPHGQGLCRLLRPSQSGYHALHAAVAIIPRSA
jgi:integrase